ncbi:hypothetical protein HYH03_003737 [Edaphochlamys debaryana]|uniref:Uncharacterized protein n=1 Tax=Edaphochlamys debaryana TaxID=47281 RepID=A0A835YIW5_9CHLO|nr:hypothetical protein HYH03_003737 [Edaphochlamys debaryana]|eukprot:KAG2498484.1 hypothetical protein HYH03_003737 [Edaphochlamys debaryana]
MRELLQQAASSAPPMGSASTPAAAAANANLGLAATLARSLLAASAPPPRPPPPGPAPPGSAPPEFPLDAAGPITTSKSGVLGGGGTGLAASGSLASAAQAPVGPAAPGLRPASASLFGGLPGGGALAAAMSALYDMSARIQRIEAHVLSGGGGGAPGQGGQPPSLSGPDHTVTRVGGDGAGGADGTVAGASGATLPSQAGPQQQERVGPEERLAAVAEQLAAALPALAGSVGRLETAAAAQAAATAQLSAAVAEVNRRLDVLSAEREAGPQRGMLMDCADSCVAEEGL